MPGQCLRCTRVLWPITAPGLEECLAQSGKVPLLDVGMQLGVREGLTEQPRRLHGGLGA